MSEKAVMLYGYGKDTAASVEEALSLIFGEGIEMISASGMEDSIILQVLDSGGSGNYEEKEEKVLMLIGFNSDEIDAVLNGYPRDAGKRPLFCTPTQENLRWKVSYLLEHLMEERAYWSARANKGSQQ